MDSGGILYDNPSQMNIIRKTSRAIFGSSMDPPPSSLAKSDFGVVETFEVATPAPTPSSARTKAKSKFSGMSNTERTGTATEDAMEAALRWKNRCLLRACERYDRGYKTAKLLRRHLKDAHDLTEDVARMRLAAREAEEESEEPEEDELAGRNQEDVGGDEEDDNELMGYQTGEQADVDDWEDEAEDGAAGQLHDEDAEAAGIVEKRENATNMHASATSSRKDNFTLTIDGESVTHAGDFTCIFPKCDRYNYQYASLRSRVNTPNHP